jgi:membrane-bound metal-dependent hydrolase YbcI (DUF457 family)
MIANFPDIDFLFFLVIGKKAFAIHQYYTHNVFFTGFFVLVFLPLLSQGRERVGFALVGFSHLLLDILVIDAAPPHGIRLFYPLWEQLFYCGLSPNLQKDTLAAVFSLRNLGVLVFETVVYLLPVLIYYRKDFSCLKRKEFWELT